MCEICMRKTHKASGKCNIIVFVFFFLRICFECLVAVHSLYCLHVSPIHHHNGYTVGGYYIKSKLNFWLIWFFLVALKPSTKRNQMNLLKTDPRKLPFSFAFKQDESVTFALISRNIRWHCWPIYFCSSIQIGAWNLSRACFVIISEKNVTFTWVPQYPNMVSHPIT